MSLMELNTLLDLFCFFSPLKIDFCGLGVESSGYGALVIILLWSLVSASTDMPYLLDGYGVLVCRIGKPHRAFRKSKTVSSISQPLQMLHMDLFGPTFVKSIRKKMYCLVVTDDYSRVENLIDQKVKVIRCENETEFKNKEMNQFCERKDIKREFSIARTPQQNGVAERKNRTLIEAARTILADSKLPTTFWAEAVNTVCYVQNRVLVTKPHNKTPYELFLSRKPALSFMRPFGCLVTILDTIDHLGKFDGKADEGFFVGYSINSIAFEVFNSRTRIVEENMHVQFSKNTPNIAGRDDEKKVNEDTRKDNNQENGNRTNNVNVAGINEVKADGITSIELLNDLNMPELEEISRSSDAKDKRLVAQGYTQQERIDYDELFAPATRSEAIRLFSAYASFKDFVVYQMDVKSAFLYGKFEEEVYVSKPPRFKDSDFPDRVYKVKKALYGLHQAPRAWDKGDILLVQMSSMGELTFFLGLQVKQKEEGICISQNKYVTEILKKFGFTDVKIASTPMETQKPLLKDEDDEEVDVYLYRSMIGSLMYLTSSRPDIMFVVCACARYQVNPKLSHLHGVKRIFRYLKGQPKLGLWYPKYSPFDLVAYTNSDYAGASLDRKSTTGGCQFLINRLISW
nr:putative ribonuclease H-like domain-containing protein [Tanacetum cinerariifolium]